MFQDIIVPSKPPETPNQKTNIPDYHSAATSRPSNPNNKKREGFRGLLSVISIFIVASLLAVGITKFVFQSYQVDGPSMEVTLQDNDRLIVMKAAKTWSRIQDKPYVPKRHDIIVFNSTTTFDNGTKRQLIKRVIGLPGDRVLIKDGEVTVYNDEFPDGLNPDKDQDYAVAFESTAGNIDLTLEKDEIFVLGDNRSNSLDSRNFGKVPIENIVGYLSLRIYPLNNIKAFN